MTRKHIKVEQMDWDDNLDLNSLGDLCDPFNLTARNKARHRHIMDMALEVENVEWALKIVAAYPYLRDEYGERIAKVAGERVVHRLDLE